MQPMAQMFSDKPDFKLSQNVKLSENTNEWQEEILRLVHEKVPQRSGLKAKLNLQKIDEEKGYGVGSVALMDPNSQKQISIPIIIKAWHLSPLDVFIQDEKAKPFNQDTIQEAMFDPDIFSGTVPGGRKPDDVFYDDSLYSQTFPPIFGKYTYSSPYKVLNAISGTLGGEDIERFNETIENDQLTLKRFIKHGAAEIVSGVASEKGSVDKDRKTVAKKIFAIKKDSPNEYRIWGNSDVVFDPTLYSTDRKSLVDFINSAAGIGGHRASDVLNDVDRVGHFVSKPPLGDKPLERSAGPGVPSRLGVAKKTPFLFNPRADDGTVKKITEAGYYALKDRAGVLAKGYVVPNVIDFSGKKTGLKIFISRDHSSAQSSFAGVRLDETAGIQKELSKSAPEPGKTGVFLYEDKDGLISTVPFMIDALHEHNGTLGIKGHDNMGKPMNIILVEGIQAIGKADHSPMLGPLTSKSIPNYYVPASFKWVELGNLRHLTETAEDFKKEAMADLLDASPLRIIGLGGRFVFKGVEKYASAAAEADIDLNSLEPHEAKFLLCSWGCTPELSSEILKEASGLAKAEVHRLTMTPLPESGLSKVAAEKLPIFDEIKRHGVSLTKFAARINLEKKGADVRDAETVDKVLALNFINSQNVQRFVGAIPQYQEVISSLAKMVLASRMGMTDIPEDSAVSAMNEMSEVVHGLERLRLLGNQVDKM